MIMTMIVIFVMTVTMYDNYNFYDSGIGNGSANGNDNR